MTPQYDVYATRFDDAHVVETLLPARGLSFSMPVSDDGEASFTATVQPGRSDWRRAIGLPMSGIVITRDGVPWWSGRINAERQSGPRTFQFSAKEWGSFFADCPAPSPRDYLATNSHDAMRDAVAAAQGISGQDVKVTTTAGTVGRAFAGVQVKAWDTLTVADVIRAIGEADGGPEWYIGTSGTLDNPARPLVVADRLGNATVEGDAVLHYVEHTEDFNPDDAAGVALLSDIFPTGMVVQELGRRGGNVLAVARERDLARSATQVFAIGDGSDAAQLRKSSVASTLIGRGWPRITKFTQHGGVSDPSTLQRLADADLAAMGGIATRYSMSTLDGDPDWTQIPRGSQVRVILDTDVYGIDRPYTFETRVLDISVAASDDGPAQVTWSLAETMEVR